MLSQCCLHYNWGGSTGAGQGATFLVPCRIPVWQEAPLDLTVQDSGGSLGWDPTTEDS